MMPQPTMWEELVEGAVEYPSTALLEEELVLDECNSKEDNSEAFSLSDVVESEEEIPQCFQ